MFFFDASGFGNGCISRIGVKLLRLFYRGGNRRQQRVRTLSEAATLMETLPHYQPLSHLFSHEKFFRLLNLVSRRDRANELSFLSSDPSK